MRTRAVNRSASRRPFALRARCHGAAVSTAYAADPEVRGPARQTYPRRACAVCSNTFLYRDLERGWRVTAPNLEDCGLLRFDYDGLTGEEGLLGDDRVVGNRVLRTTKFQSALRAATPGELREDSSSARCSTCSGGSLP